MKKIILGLCSASLLFAGSIKGGLEDSQVNALQKLIVLSGYKCDDVSSAIRSSWDGSFRVTCNDNSYVYGIEDIGGQWTVKVK